MALRKRGKYWYGDSQADIRDELVRVGKLTEYIPTHFADARCTCLFPTAVPHIPHHVTRWGIGG